MYISVEKNFFFNYSKKEANEGAVVLGNAKKRDFILENGEKKT